MEGAYANSRAFGPETTATDQPSKHRRCIYEYTTLHKQTDMLEYNGRLKLLLRMAGAALVTQAFLMYSTSGKQLYILRPQSGPPTD